MPEHPVEEALIALSAASVQMHPDDIAGVARAAGAGAGLADIVVYVVDLDQRLLVPLPVAPGDPPPPSLSVDGTVAGRAYRTERPVIVPRAETPAASGGTVVWLPLMDGAERLGVISATVDPVRPDDEHLRRWLAFTGVVAEILVTKMPYGDLITRTRRARELTLAAEMRWALLPPLTFTGRNVSISGIVLPSYEVAGDAFDYAVNGNIAHIAILDAVGHGLEASRIANLAVSAYRNGRRGGRDMVQVYREMDAVLISEFGDEKFATAQLASLDLSTGCLSWLNAGHPHPMVIRRGHRVDLASNTCLPVGLSAPDASLTVTSLEPGDIVLLFTDGITEARSTSGAEFGRERLADFIERAVAGNQTPAETVRLLAIAVLAHQNDVLQDDATILLVKWNGPPTQ